MMVIILHAPHISDALDELGELSEYFGNIYVCGGQGAPDSPNSSSSPNLPNATDYVLMPPIVIYHDDNSHDDADEYENVENMG